MNDKDDHTDEAASSACPVYQVYTCGPFLVKRWDGASYQAVPVGAWGGSHYPRLLLKVLVCSPGRQTSRGRLLETLWPDIDPEESGRYLNDAAYRLRKVLQPPMRAESLLLTQDSHSYRLPVQEVLWVDADEAFTLLQRAEDVEQGGTDPLPLVEEATGYLSRGEFLAEEEHLSFYGRRATVARARRGGLLAQARLYQQRGGLRRGEALLSNIVEENAFDEDALCALMLNLHQQGRTSEGLRLYEETKALLEREGLAPTETTRATAQQVRRAFSLVGEHQRATLLPSLSDSLPEDQQARTPESFIPTTPLISDASMHHVLTLPISLTEPQPSSEIMVPDFTTQFGVMCAQILTLVQQWYGMARFYHALQDHVDQHIKKLDMLKSLSSLETYTLSRRSFLTTLAALPATCLASRKQVHIMSLDVEELLPQCAASITSCWHLSGGSHLNAIGPIIDSYVPTLVAIMKNAPSYREVAADLVAQCYFLKAILAWHVQGLTLAETYCLQALHYSDIAQNINLRLTALNQHALISYYAKQFPKALAKSEEASAILQRTSQEHIFPIVQGRVFMYLAAFQAQQQSSADAEHTLEQARHAFDLQATLAEPVPLYADCGNASLTLWEGLAQYHLSLHDATHAERALLSLRTFGRLQSDMEIPERFRLECLINRILAASQCNEMEEAIDCFEAANQGSKALESKQRSAEVESAFRDMLRHWPKEKQVQHVGAFLYAKE